MPRIHIENTLYYITSRGDHEQNIFVDKEDYTNYIALLKKCKGRYNFRLFAFVLLNNHIHLLVEPKEGTNISQIMYALNSSYTKHFSARHHKAGHLFQERYKMALLEKGPYLANMTAYIHLNPKILGLVSDITDYPYSSYPSYLYFEEGRGGRDHYVFELDQEVKEVSGYTGGRRYRDFICGIAPETLRDIGNELSKKPIIGSEEFVEKVRSKAESEKRRQGRISRANILRSPLIRRFIVGGGTAILVLGALALYLYVRQSAVREDYAKNIKNRDVELTERLIEERAKIAKDADRRYRAQADDYYKKMSKTLETEKQKAKFLEERLTKEADKK